MDSSVLGSPTAFIFELFIEREKVYTSVTARISMAKFALPPPEGSRADRRVKHKSWNPHRCTPPQHRFTSSDLLTLVRVVLGRGDSGGRSGSIAWDDRTFPAPSEGGAKKVRASPGRVNPRPSRTLTLIFSPRRLVASTPTRAREGKHKRNSANFSGEIRAAAPRRFQGRP